MSLPASDPVEAFRRVLCRYLRERGGMLFSLAGASGQRTARIALLALYRRHESEETGYLRFEHVLAALEECGEPCTARLREMGVVGFEEAPRSEGGGYLVVDLERLRRLAGEC